jgi:hypothetical protein
LARQLWRLTAHKIAEIFGARPRRRLPGKLATVIDQNEHGHHVFRAYFKHAFLKQYEKFATFLRNELCSNNLNDFGLKKGLDNLDAVRQTFKVITSRFAGFQAQWLNVHIDFPRPNKVSEIRSIGSSTLPKGVSETSDILGNAHDLVFEGRFWRLAVPSFGRHHFKSGLVMLTSSFVGGDPFATQPYYLRAAKFERKCSKCTTQMSPFGPSRHIAAPRNLGRKRGIAEIDRQPSIARKSLVTQLYGPAVAESSDGNGWSCASVSGPCVEQTAPGHHGYPRASDL